MPCQKPSTVKVQASPCLHPCKSKRQDIRRQPTPSPEGVRPRCAFRRGEGAVPGIGRITPTGWPKGRRQGAIVGPVHRIRPCAMRRKSGRLTGNRATREPEQRPRGSTPHGTLARTDARTKAPAAKVDASGGRQRCRPPFSFSYRHCERSESGMNATSGSPTSSPTGRAQPPWGSRRCEC